MRKSAKRAAAFSVVAAGFAGSMLLAMGCAIAEAGPQELVGEPAPALELELLSGGTLNLSALKGEKNVILDFWASWCGPCVRALPILAEVAKEFEDRDVVLYAVNLREDPKTIEAFLKANNLSVPVALDRSGDVAGRYNVHGIPQTVVVGKDGKVADVHVGFSSDLKNHMARVLKRIAGE